MIRPAKSWVSVRASGIILSTIIAGIADANGDPAKPFNNVFDERETFQHAEIGYASLRDRQFIDNVHLTLWHQDEREEAGVRDDWGVSESCSWLFRNTWAPFLWGGWADGDAARYEASVSAGVAYLTRQQDLFGLAVNWARPGGAVATTTTRGPSKRSTSTRPPRFLRSPPTSS